MRILVVEDDLELAAQLCAALEAGRLCGRPGA